MAKIDPSPIKLTSNSFSIDEQGNLSVDITRNLLVNDVKQGSGLVEVTRREAADGVGEPKDGYIAEDVEFEIYFSETEVTKHTERFYYKITPPKQEPKDKFTPINVLLSRSTSNPCQDLTGGRLTSLELFYDKNANSPFGKPLYTRQVKENTGAEQYRWNGIDNRGIKFQWAQFPDATNGSEYFYKINYPPDDIDPTEGAGVEISNANSDRKTCNVTRDVYKLDLFLAKNYSTSEDVTKNMICTPSYTSRGGTFTRSTIEVYVLDNPNAESFDLTQQILFEEDGVTPINPIEINVFGNVETNNLTVKLADNDIAPYYYLGESTVTTPLFKDAPCYKVGNQLGVCFVASNEEDNELTELTDCDIVDNQLAPGSEGGPPESKVTAVCRGFEYTWNGTQWYKEDENAENPPTGNPPTGNPPTGNPPSTGGPGGPPPSRTRGIRIGR